MGTLTVWKFDTPDGADEATGVLRDLATSEHVGLFLGPALLTSLPLDAAAAIAKLRECSENGGPAQ